MRESVMFQWTRWLFPTKYWMKNGRLRRQSMGKILLISKRSLFSILLQKKVLLFLVFIWMVHRGIPRSAVCKSLYLASGFTHYRNCKSLQYRTRHQFWRPKWNKAQTRTNCACTSARSTEHPYALAPSHPLVTRQIMSWRWTCHLYSQRDTGLQGV